jgi:hypothetical protein
MDDIARDVVQRQAPHERQAHNEYVVARPETTPRFPWHGLDRDIQEQILQDAQPLARRYFTNPGGGFNWAELERGVRAQILRHVCDRIDLQLHGHEPWPASYDRQGHTFDADDLEQDLPTIQNLSFVTQGHDERDFRRMPADFRRMPARLLHVTFSTRLWRPRTSTAPTWAPTRAMEDALYAQMQRTYSWTDVCAIRLIRHLRHPDEPLADYYTFQIVRRGEHGDEVIEAPESFQLSRRERDELERQLSTRLGMQYRVMRELGFRTWPSDFAHMGLVYDRERANGEYPNGLEWSVLPVPAGSGFREL